MRVLWLIVIGLTVGTGGTSMGDDFKIRDGDTVVFLGDSITAARKYTAVIENYVLLRYPERKVRFVNAGWGGDTAQGGLERLEQDVFAHGATLVTVAYGVNDIGWGMLADDEHRQAYLDGIRGIVDRCRDRSVRVFICSAAVTGADPFESEDGFLQKMCDDGLEIARSGGAGTIDVQRGMREIQKRVWTANEAEDDPDKKTTLHAADGVHLNDLGQLAMAFVILKGLGAPADVSTATIDAAVPQVTAATGCSVSDLEGSVAGLSFTRCDDGLPINFGLFGALNFRFIPIPDRLNRYMLTVRGLDPGRYELRVNDRLLGAFHHERFARGINISSATADPWQPGGPWEAQAGALVFLTEARNGVGLSELWATRFFGDPPNLAELLDEAKRVNASLESYQRTVAQPAPYRFEIRPAPAAEPAEGDE